ncbi:MAG: GlsB/YeaQ/YmgE family stress response membrane protein [Pseudomonadota bacterium]
MKNVARSLLLSLSATPALAQDGVETAFAAEGILVFVIPILIGALVGWIASLIAKGGGSGFLGNALIGIGGSYVAFFILPGIGFSLDGLFGTFVSAVIGAVLLLIVIGLIRKIVK